MLNPSQSPDDGRLRALLRAARPAPPLPRCFPESVWRRIAIAETAEARMPTPFSWLERWVEHLLRPRFALASLTLMLMAGGLMGLVTSDGAAKQRAQERYLSVIAPAILR
jgi:hypothetical protein